jgi:hypothetical protein
MFETVPGVPRSRTRILNFAGSQEIDIGLWNDKHPDGLRFLRTDVILIECKNWLGPVTSAEVAWFDTKVRQRSLSFGIIFAARGVTGNSAELTAARHIIAQALAEGRRLIVVTSSEIANLRSADDLVHLLKDKLFELHLTQSGLP